jgi:hypothetical protein
LSLPNREKSERESNGEDTRPICTAREPKMKWRLGPLLRAQAVLSLVTAIAGAAGADTIQELHDWCKEPHSAPRSGYCLGYVSGIAEMMLKLGHDHPEDAHGMCGEPTRAALVQAFVNWAEKHPEEWGSSDQLGVRTALAEIWPCPAK